MDGSWVPDELDHAARTEFSTYRELLDRLIETSGFEIVDLAVRDRLYAAYTCVRR